MIYGSYYKGCTQCRLCEGAAYQLPPFLFAGSETPEILVIAQNPGEIGDKDKWRLSMGKLLPLADPAAAKILYDLDFITSHGHNQMAKIFGEEWLTNGKFMYTNAVRCRTKDNLSPQPEMVNNCMNWTSQLPIPRVVVLMGNVAMRQFSNMVKKPELTAWRIVKMKREGEIVHVLTIPHYAAMRSHEDIEKARDMFQKVAEMAGIND